MTSPLRVADIAALAEALAPRDLAEPWDHVGLQVGAADQPVERVLVALEVTDDVVRRLDATPTLVVSHHPLLFRPLEAVRADRPTGRHVAALLRADASLIACHTNWDKAPGGTDDALAQALGLTAPVPLVPAERALYRLSVIVPEESLDELRDALAAAGAGESERYRRASFSVHGESTYEAREGAHPVHGAVGALSVRGEHRLEMVVSGERLGAATHALLAAHPYEEPAWGVDRLHRGARFGGLGRIGDWPEPTTATGLAGAVGRALEAPGVRVAGRVDAVVLRVASVGGSGRSLLTAAAEAGADAVVTADIGHHDARLAEELGLAVVDAGHRETEMPGVRALRRELERRLRAAGHPLPVELVEVAPAFAWRVDR